MGEYRLQHANDFNKHLLAVPSTSASPLIKALKFSEKHPFVIGKVKGAFYFNIVALVECLPSFTQNDAFPTFFVQKGVHLRGTDKMAEKWANGGIKHPKRTFVTQTLHLFLYTCHARMHRHICAHAHACLHHHSFPLPFLPSLSPSHTYFSVLPLFTTVICCVEETRR